MLDEVPLVANKKEQKEGELREGAKHMDPQSPH